MPAGGFRKFGFCARAAGGRAPDPPGGPLSDGTGRIRTCDHLSPRQVSYHARRRSREVWARDEIIKPCESQRCMAPPPCSICGRVSGSGQDHLDCVQKRRVELEDEDFKQKIPERMDAAAGSGLAPEIRALIEHMAKEKGGGGG